MKVLDLFSGLCGWSEPFAAHGHETFTVDSDYTFEADLVRDVRYLTPDDIPFWPDVIFASPPCNAFSVNRIGHNWDWNEPRSSKAEISLALVEHVVNYLIPELSPAYWFLENPRGKLRSLPVVEDFPRVTITQCQYGRSYMKPTDIWGHFPPNWKPRPSCHNGDPCHDRAPRGSQHGSHADHKGVSAMSYDEAAMIPPKLSIEIRDCLEELIDG